MVVCLVPHSAPTIAPRSDVNLARYWAVALARPRDSTAASPPVDDGAAVARLAAVARQRDSATAVVPYCRLAVSYRHPDSLAVGPD